MSPPTILYQSIIRRADLRANPQATYIFGDNLAKIGYGGQAKEMRGEPNAFGIPTKQDPATCFSNDFSTVWKMAGYWVRQMDELKIKPIIVFPYDGIGTGLSAMPTECPDLFRSLNMILENYLGIRNLRY